MFERGMIIQNRYEIIEEVGSGGMSIVYKAKCHVLNRYVAIKVLKPEFSDDKSFVSKFRIEAQSAAGLSHPNIVNVFDVGEENGFHYIVMELVEGITLKEYIQQNGRLPYTTALDFIMQITAGIEVAHEHHTIHRDIKPQNIIVSKNGTLKVTDFGIAKAATSNTIASSAMGSVHYISPEQARGGYSDERSDIYSLGITLYEMLTGRVPFEGENNVTVALMHIQSEMIPPREFYPDIPIGLERIVMKATQKKPEKRYLTTATLMMDLKKVLANPNAMDVGVIGAVMMDNSPTIQISPEELASINSAASPEEGIAMFPVNNRTSQELEDANKALESLYNDDYEDEDDESVFDDYEEEDEDDSKDLNPKMEKIITIGAIAATVIIAIVVILIVASFTGAFKGKDKKTESTQEVTTEAISEMIDVLNLSEEEAKAALDEAGIEYEIERDYSSEYDEGKVMSQSVSEGEAITEDTVVKLVISKGEELVTVPNVVDKTEEEARAILQAAGFSVKVDEENSDEVEEGNVISQEPGGDKQAAKGSTITIVVSEGKEIKLAVVPDLKKKTVTEAETALSEVKLKLGNVTQEYDDSIKEGQVISQSISAETEVTEGTAVDITISKGKKPTVTTYTASFSGAITNASYSFEEGETVTVTMTLRYDDVTYSVVSGSYSSVSFPIQLSNIPSITGLPNKKATLVYSVKDESGTDITGHFTSSGQANFKSVKE